MKKILLTLFVIYTIQTQSKAQNIDSFFEKTSTFFSLNVSNGKIDYASIYKNPHSLNELLELSKNIKVDKTNMAVYKAFWINSYNLSVIKGIINNYPTNSPLDISGFFDKITYNIGGTKTTLNNIENTFLRANFKDPRFHFVLVCGAIGCPPIINKAYLPNTLETQLEEQTKLALNGNYFIKINIKKKRIIGSEILKWYKEDFTLNGTKEIDFINKYRIEKIPNNYKLTYFTYNWKLNKQ